MSTKLPQWTSMHSPSRDLRAWCNQGIEQHAAYVGGARMIMMAAGKPTSFMTETYARLVSVCQCTSCLVRRIRKERGSPRHPQTWQLRFFDPRRGAGRKLDKSHALGCLIRKPCEACLQVSHVNPIMVVNLSSVPVYPSIEEILDTVAGRVDMVFNMADVLNSAAGVGQGYPVRVGHFTNSCNNHEDCARALTDKHCHRHDCEGC